MMVLSSTIYIDFVHLIKTNGIRIDILGSKYVHTSK